MRHNESLDWIEYELVNEDYAGAAERIANRVRLRGDWIVRTDYLPEHDTDRLRTALVAKGCETDVEDGWLTVVPGPVMSRELARTVEVPPVPMQQLVYGGCR